ncbi:K(+)/H(+) antiporter NhaP2 [bioreactor metagenome]|uniref:K(+)/H(+) antiporter NhaP2 n=1 Tax=bioreactor metagenome TaxID=1076179 RepID=A0A644YL25_9ZZZZ
MLAYAAPTAVGGNGYLSAYFVGIVLGNNRILNKRALVHFFDGVTGLMQMLIFFLLGLLSFPSRMPAILLPAILIALFLTFVARPAAVFSILSPFRCSARQKLLVSWAGLRGAASIVFAIIAMLNPAAVQNDVFHIVFCIVLFSIALQGSLLPLISKKLNMIDESENVMRTFSDYSDEVPVQYIKLTMSSKHPWNNLHVRDLSLPPDTLLVLILRGSEQIIPKGKSVILENDRLVLSAPALEDNVPICLSELKIDKNSHFKDKRIVDLKQKPDHLIMLVKRQGRVIIPSGKTILRENDVLVISGIDA